MRDLSNENIIHVKKAELEYIQFKRLLEYENIKHCFTLKPLDFASNATYEEKKIEVEKNLNALSEEFKFDVKNICRPKQTHTDKVEKVEDTNESLVMKINEMASLENIQFVSKNLGLAYNNENIKTIE